MIKPKKYARIPTNKRGTTGTVLEKKKDSKPQNWLKSDWTLLEMFI